MAMETATATTATAPLTPAASISHRLPHRLPNATARSASTNRFASENLQAKRGNWE